MSNWRITVTDIDMTGGDMVCTTLPVATTVDLRKGSLTITDVGSCISLTLGFACAAGH
jgi:hypothetical protein